MIKDIQQIIEKLETYMLIIKCEDSCSPFHKIHTKTFYILKYIKREQKTKCRTHSYKNFCRKIMLRFLQFYFI